MVGPWGLLFVSVKIYDFSWSLALDAAFVFIVTSGGIEISLPLKFKFHCDFFSLLYS
jgi:hypothetical protein